MLTGKTRLLTQESMSNTSRLRRMVVWGMDTAKRWLTMNCAFSAPVLGPANTRSNGGWHWPRV